jgi:hypothetical protein
MDAVGSTTGFQGLLLGEVSPLMKKICSKAPYNFSEGVAVGKSQTKKNRRYASVACSIRVLRNKSTGEVKHQLLMIKRASREGDPWSGDLALPGGHVEDNEDDIQAACRETLEEVGLDIR